MHRRTFVFLGSGIAVALILALGYAWQRDRGSEAGEPNLLDAVNAKLQQQGEPTISREDDTGSGRRVDPTVEAIADATLGALPTESPRDLTCGPASERSGSLTWQRTNRGCVLVGNSWVVTTAGDAQEGGIVALFPCAQDDSSCLAGGEPKSGQWTVLKPRVSGSVKMLMVEPPDSVIVDSGGAQLCVDVRTLAWDEGCSLVGTAVAERAAALTPVPAAEHTPSGAQ